MASVEKLILANPWARVLESQLQALRPTDLAALSAPSAPKSLDIFAAPRRAFHEQLSAEGTTGWNRWAHSMLQLRPAVLGQASEPALLWRALAFVDLSNSQFTGDLNWEGRSFPWNLCVSHSRFRGYAYLSAIRVLGDVAIENVLFERDCWIDQWAVDGSALFSFTSWAGRVEGRASRFAGMLDARSTKFTKDCWFVGSTIEGAANFTGAQFGSDAGFSKCRFLRDASFDAVSFDDTVGMEDCVFAGALSFRDTSFAKRLFLNRASFTQEPVIDRAKFAMAPNLTDARFPGATGIPASSPLRAAGFGP